MKSKATVQKYQRVESFQQNAPSMVDPFITPALITALIAGGRAGTDASTALYNKFKPTDKLAFHVLDSTLVDGEHQVVLNLINVTGHGLYLESMFLKRPADVDVRVRLEGDTFQYGADKVAGFYELQSLLPRLIASGDKWLLKLYFTEQDRQSFAKKPHVTFEYEYSELNEEKPPVKDEFSCRIRWKRQPAAGDFIRREKSIKNDVGEQYR